MFISNQLVYLELHKTGSSHIKRILGIALEGERAGKHNRATKNLFTERRVFVGSVRNPWDWYVSLWGFGCNGKGALYQRLTRPPRPLRRLRGLGWRASPSKALTRLLSSHISQTWIATYRDVNDPAAFRDWLQMLHDPTYCADIGEGYSGLALSRAAGLMTFRYLNLFSTRAGESGQLKGLSTQDDIVAWDAEQTFIDEFIRKESLEEDIFRIFHNHDIVLADEARAKILALPKTNTSSRNRELANYYDPDTLALVADREQLIINKFGYKPPEL